jgi:AcrR family transcriptional regulator
MPRVTKSVEERKQEIVDTARILFTKNGFDKTQMSDISHSMNAAQGLVYHYFKSKTDILYAVIDELAAEQSEMMKQVLLKSDGSALEGLRLLFNNQPDYERYGQLIPSLMSDQAIIEYCTKKMTVSALPLLLSLIERGNADGSWNCEYPKETAIFIFQGFSGLIGLSNAPSNEESKIQAFTNIIFRILGAEPEAPL